MDYPKSIPSVGLVNGKFVDENPVAGTPGSLIPSAWGNSVTQEMLNVITAGGMVPAEADLSQLLKAMKLLMAKASPMLSIVSTLTASKVLGADELGLVLVNATAAATTISLPVANASLGVRDVIIRRVDNTNSRLVVQSSGTDKIKFHTHLSVAGYPFLVLMGAGDWWHLRSDGAGSWWPVGRFDSTPLGRPFFETTMTLTPGGYGPLNGQTFKRAEWPWLWDHAQLSGMVVAENALPGKEGSWSSGDGTLTFRAPENRGMFLRMLDEARNRDPGRVAGSWQKGSLVQGDNGADDSILFAADIMGQKVQLGFDDGSYQDYAGSNVKFLTTAIPATRLPDSELIKHGGIARPQNIAYPGRIKLI